MYVDQTTFLLHPLWLEPTKPVKLQFRSLKTDPSPHVSKFYKNDTDK